MCLCMHACVCVRVRALQIVDAFTSIRDEKAAKDKDLGKLLRGAGTDPLLSLAC